MKYLYFTAVLGFQAARMTSSISHGKLNCARECPIGWLLKIEALETVGELSTVWMVGKAFLNLKGTEWGDLSGGRALLETNAVLSIHFDMAAPTRLKGENTYILWVFQLKLKAFTAIQYGFGIQETYLSICLLRRVANLWSTCGVNWNLSLKILNNLWESIHSLLSLKTLNILSAIILSAAGIMLEELQKPLFCANSHICFAISLQRTECMPPILLIYANAVLLSVKRWTCLTLSYARNTTLEPIRWLFVPNH